MVAEITSSSSPAQCPIKTVVVLVQENRSFDHMLGWMKSLNPHLDGVTGSESNPVSTSDTNSPLVYFGDTSGYVDPDPGHSIQAIFEQVFGLTWPQYTSSSSSSSDAYDNNDPITLRPEMKGFAQNAERIEKGMSASVMNGFRPEKVPVYKELVAEFGVCDRWFASVPASTQPNRMYVHSATSHGATSNDVKKLVEGFPQKTVFESLDETGLSFGIYYQYPPATLFFRNLRKLKYLKNLYQFDVHFKRDCEEGKLPNYVVIEQRYFDLLSVPANDDHPSHDVSEGQKFVKQVYEALRGSPQWHEILFVITYDEHGGFYDHVPTPVTGVPSPDGIVGPDPYNFKFDRLGVRVPTFFISPWIERGTVLHKPSGPTLTSEFEHSSIPATVKKIFNLKDFLTKRDAWAGTFETVLNRTTPRTDCPVTLPEPELKLRAGDADEDTKLSDFQQELVLMAAALIGDGRVVGNMKVGEGAKYVEDAFDRFKYHCEKAMARGVDESEILLLPAAIAKKREPKSFGRKLLACLACNN